MDTSNRTDSLNQSQQAPQPASSRSTRCYFVDAYKRTVEEIPFKGGLARIQELIGDDVRVIRQVNLDVSGDVMYINKAHMKVGGAYFAYGKYVKVHGRAVILGRSDIGNMVSPKMTFKQLESDILFQGDTRLGSGFRS